MVTQHFAYLFMIWWMFRCFHSLATVSHAATGIHGDIFVEIPVFSYLDFIPRSGIARSHNSLLKFWGNATVFQIGCANSRFCRQGSPRVPASPGSRRGSLFRRGGVPTCGRPRGREVATTLRFSAASPQRLKMLSILVRVLFGQLCIFFFEEMAIPILCSF